MITEKDYLIALQIVKDYKLQQKKKTEKIVLKINSINHFSNIEIKSILENDFKNNDFYYSQTLSILKNVFATKLKIKIGRNSQINILKVLIARKIILKNGDYGFQKYFLNENQ